MRNFKWIFSSAILYLFSLSGCLVDIYDDINFENCISGAGDTETRTIELDPFRKITLDIHADVYLTQGPKQAVRIEGRSNILDALNTSITNNGWNITSDQCLRNTGDIKIYITLPKIDRIALSASGAILGENLIQSQELEIVISGSGHIELNVEATKINGELSGSGNINLTGISQDLAFGISGAGNINAFDLETNNTAISISGSGRSNLHVSNHLKARVSGSGNIYYRGNPTLDVEISGSGEVVDAN